MNFSLVYFLLVSSLSITVSERTILPLKIHDIEELIKNGNTNFSGKREHNLTLSAGEKLGKTQNSMVWKGFYNGKEVAIKIIWQKTSFDREIEILKALNATDDLRIEERGIPRVYYHGPYLRKYNAIAMTLFDGTLENHYKSKNVPTSDVNILMWFRRAVEILKYFHEKRIVHNDIKPGNLFLRGSEIFISDFDGATLNGDQTCVRTTMYASSEFYADRDRYEMDDVESLVFSMWYIAGVPIGGAFINGQDPEGYVLCECKKLGKAEARMHEKCNQIDNVIVRKAFKFVCINEILLSKRKIPKYDLIIEVLTGAIEAVNEKIESMQFEMILEGAVKSSASSIFSRILSTFR